MARMPPRTHRAVLRLESLESRDPGATASLSGTTLTVMGTAGNDRILIQREAGNLVVRDSSGVIGRFNPARVGTITIRTGNGNDVVKIAAQVTNPATIIAGNGKDVLQAGGGPTRITGGGPGTIMAGGSSANTLVGGTGSQKLVGGTGSNTVLPGPGDKKVVNVTRNDTVLATPTTRVAVNNPRPIPADRKDALLSTAQVNTLLRRAAAASASDDAIIAVVDRNGRILGVRTEGGVAPQITGNLGNLVFAIDGAVSLARTGAFFANNQAPLTTRTIRNLSQSTITQREVESNPNVPNLNSTLRGPGFVAPVGVGGHFPPNVPNTPPVDLFGIEHTNRDGSVHPGADGIRGTTDDIALPARFNIDPAFVPAGQGLFAPDSYGFASGLLPTAQSRGIATLPGGIPIFLDGTVAGGIGVFFPGKTGFATEENSVLGTTYDPSKPDRSLEAEYIALAAVGGSSQANNKIGTINGVPLPAGFDLPFGRIDLGGITLDVFGPGGDEGIKRLLNYGRLLGVGNPDTGVNRLVAPGATLLAGLPVPTGWLVMPHNGVGITASEVEQIIANGMAQAVRTRAAIRLPLSSQTRMVFAVADRNGSVVGLYRMPDATVFSIDVAVAKARNVNYYADKDKLQPADRVPGVPPGTAFTNRTFRYLALPRFPSTVDLNPPAPFSILNDGGSNPLTALQIGARLPARAFQSVYGHDAFFPATNFHDRTNIANQNGIVFFPGSAPLYKAGRGLLGGFGVSGDGVNQDDVVTAAGVINFEVIGAPRADQVVVAGVRLPYFNFSRNPDAF